MKDIKSAVSPSGTGLAVLRIILSLVFSGSIGTMLMLMLGKFLEFCSVPTDVILFVEQYGPTLLIPIVILFNIVYIRRTLRRRYAYSYMENYMSALSSDGYNTCPRCGSSVSEKRGTASRRVHVADKITTTHYSDGSKSTNTEAVYQNQSYQYTYYKCNNPACALRDDLQCRFGDMPHKVRDLRVLILGERHPKGRPAAGLVDGGRRLNRVLLIILLVVAVAVAGFMFRDQMSQDYGAFGGKDVEGIDVSASLGKEEKALLSQVRGIIKDAKEYNLWIAQVGNGPFSSDKDIYVTYFVDDKLGNGYTVEFDGLKSDSGLEGEFTLMPYKGEKSLFHEEELAIYSADSDFYKTHYQSLKKWTGKAVVTDVLDKIKTGQLYENYTDQFVLRSDGLSVYVNEAGAVCLLDETGEQSLRYIFTPEDTAKPYDYADYRPVGYEDAETDELQKLLNTGSHDVAYSFYKDDEEVGEVDYCDNGDGSHTFDLFEAYNGIERGSYVVYPDENRYVYYPYESEYTLSTKGEEKSAKSNQKTFNWFKKMIPNTFIREHLHLDKAEKVSLLGIAVQYTEQLGDGKRSELEVVGGVVKSFDYYESETTYTHVNWLGT